MSSWPNKWLMAAFPACAANLLREAWKRVPIVVAEKLAIGGFQRFGERAESA